MKILITGSSGQLGSKVVEVLAGEPGTDLVPLAHAALDITREESVRRAIGEARPAWVINCAAYTDVEGAEDDPGKAFLVNDAAVGLLADAALAHGGRLLHVSTDYVFSGRFPGGATRPYREEDAPDPLNAYGASKLAGEERLRAHGVRSVVLRTSWIYGGPGKNFLSTILRLGKESEGTGRPVRVVEDQRGTPTDAWSLALQVRRVIREDVSGLFHASSDGDASWYEFAAEVFRASGLRAKLEPIRSADFASKARRPPYSVLENRRLRELGLDILPHWKEGLERALTRIRGSLPGNPSVR